MELCRRFISNFPSLAVAQGSCPFVGFPFLNTRNNAGKSISNPERPSRQRYAFRHGDIWILFAFKFQRHVAGVARIGEDFGDARVV
jgi:hypothetical protein